MALRASATATTIAANPAAATRTCYAFAALALLASRDFFLLALFLCMMPRAAALSKADAANLASASVAPCAEAFFARVFAAVGVFVVAVVDFGGAAESWTWHANVRVTGSGVPAGRGPGVKLRDADGNELFYFEIPFDRSRPIQ